MKRIIALLIVLSVLAIGVATVMAADVERRDSIVGEWTTTKVVDGKTMIVVYEFTPDKEVRFSASFDGVVVTQDTVPEKLYYAVYENLIFFMSELVVENSIVKSTETSFIVLKIVRFDGDILEIIDRPLSKNDIELVKQGVDFNAEMINETIVLHRKLNRI
ncbi:MAG TPA: hypothetical protein ENH26_02730 [Candidatus Wolfebacteria bacterium]|nr:hypothetical protein [Candidatus Wolfebacteria bacterium]